MENYLPLPTLLTTILSEWHQDGVRDADCMACSSHCCHESGFAILENIILIYDKYKAGELVRTDYEFPTGLTFYDFVGKYFDIFNHPTGHWPNKKNILTFHPRLLSENNEIISIPDGGEFYLLRLSLDNNNPWLNKGCVFLSKKIPNWKEDDRDSSRVCILHNPECNVKLTEKPIDCVFFICNQQMEGKVQRKKYPLSGIGL